MSTDRIKATSENHALTMGRFYIDYDPLKVLKTLRAAVGYVGGVGYAIVLTEQGRKDLDDCIAFNEGRQN